MNDTRPGLYRTRIELAVQAESRRQATARTQDIQDLLHRIQHLASTPGHADSELLTLCDRLVASLIFEPATCDTLIPIAAARRRPERETALATTCEDVTDTMEVG